MASTDLKLDEPGTLQRPGRVGKLARLILGVLCLYYVYGLIMISSGTTSPSGSIPTMIWNGIIPSLFLVSYIINIGYSRAWKKWPAIVSVVVLSITAGIGFAMSGKLETVLLARSVWIWELYIFSHLGMAFIIAGVIGTPGCEMRAFHDLYSRLTGVPTKEHYCPVGPLNPIDQWEARQKRR